MATSSSHLPLSGTPPDGDTDGKQLDDVSPLLETAGSAVDEDPHPSDVSRIHEQHEAERHAIHPSPSSGASTSSNNGAATLQLRADSGAKVSSCGGAGAGAGVGGAACFLRSMRAVAVLGVLTSTAFIWLICLAPVTFFGLRLLSIHESRRINSFIFGHWLAMWPYLLEKVNKTQVRVMMEGEGGEKGVRAGERVLLMCNHRTEVDWMYVWSLALRKARIGHVKYVLKSSVRNVPIFGWAFHVLEFLLVTRDWRVDRHAFASLLSTFRDPADPLWLVIFPEGTDFTPEKCAKSQKYAEGHHSLPKLHHTLLPRTKGFYACLHHLRDSIDAVYDLTIGYKHPLPLFMDNATGANPKEVHIHMKRIPISDIPLSETDVSTWLINQFVRKDELLAHFYNEGVFPGTQVEGELSTISGLLNLFAVLIFTCLLLWIMLIPSLWIKVYLAFSCVMLTASSYFGYRPKSLLPGNFLC